MVRDSQVANMSRALITGGAGFIGSHLAEALLERGWTVEVVDDLSTGSIENISHLKGHPHFAYTLDSVMNRSLMLELVDRADVIFSSGRDGGVRLIVERARLHHRDQCQSDGAHPGAGHPQAPAAAAGLHLGGLVDRVPAGAGPAGDAGAGDCV